MKKAPGPSERTMSLMTVKPETFWQKLAFWIRVLTTSRGAATVIDETAPAMDAMKSEEGDQHISCVIHRHRRVLTLGPGSLRVVVQVEEPLLGGSRSTEELWWLADCLRVRHNLAKANSQQTIRERYGPWSSPIHGKGIQDPPQ